MHLHVHFFENIVPVYFGNKVVLIFMVTILYQKINQDFKNMAIWFLDHLVGKVGRVNSYVVLTVCQASNSSKSSDGDMRHITIHAEDEVKKSCRCTGCSVSPVSSYSLHLQTSVETETQKLLKQLQTALLLLSCHH